MLKNLGQYNKAFVPIVIALFALLSDRFGVQLNIGEMEATGIIALISAFLVYLVPNKTPAETTVTIPTETKITIPSVEEKVVQVQPTENANVVVVEEKPNLLRAIKQ